MGRKQGNVYNADVTPRLMIPLLLLLTVAACNRAPESKEAIREGIVEHISKNSGLDAASMDIVVESVKFEGNRAAAMVSFKPKSSPDAGMSMNYTLERSGKKWIVQKTAGSGHGATSTPVAPADGALPPGHPPVAPQTEAPTK